MTQYKRIMISYPESYDFNQLVSQESNDFNNNGCDSKEVQIGLIEIWLSFENQAWKETEPINHSTRHKIMKAIKDLDKKINRKKKKKKLILQF